MILNIELQTKWGNPHISIRDLKIYRTNHFGNQTEKCSIQLSAINIRENLCHPFGTVY